MNEKGLAASPPIPRGAAGRIEVLDSLRGLALMGIFLVHCVELFSGWIFASEAEKAGMPLASFNSAVAAAVSFLCSDKSRTIFALMFGVSFFLQFTSAERRREPFQLPFLRRLGVLLIIGLIHGHLFYGGDILRYYAVGGLILLVAHHWSNVQLVVTGLVLAVGVPLVTEGVNRSKGIDPFAAFGPPAMVNQAFQSESLLENVQMNHLTAVWRYDSVFLFFYFVPVTGIFLFGVWMARAGYLQHPLRHRSTLRRFCGWGLGAGFALQLALLLIVVIVPTPPFAVSTGLAFAYFTAPLLIILGVVSGVVLLGLRPVWQRRLAVLAPAGRMTMTNYFVQSVLGWVVFYGSGFGLYLKIGPALALPLALGLCWIQLVCSAWWLRRFHLGPLEWAWRWAVQGKRVPLRIAPVAAPA